MEKMTRSGPLLPLLAFVLHLLLSFSASLAAASDAAVPFIVTHKKASLTRLKTDVECFVDLFNRGSMTAYDVSLVDDSWPQDMFDLVSGNTKMTWERLDAGSTASHSFVLEAKAKGLFHGSPVVIKFRVPTKAAIQEAYSTPILPLDILSKRPP